jgi:hypothetical protein
MLRARDLLVRMTSTVLIADRRELRRLIVAAFVLLAAVAALAGYLFHLQRSTERQWLARPQFPTETQPLAGTPTEISLMIADDAGGRLVTKKISMVAPSDASQRIKAELQALLAESQKPGSMHAFPPESEVLSVFLVADDAAVVDLSSGLAASGDSQSERLSVQSMTQTIAANHPAIRRVKFLVGGAEREPAAGHLDLRVWFLTAPGNGQPAK